MDTARARQNGNKRVLIAEQRLLVEALSIALSGRGFEILGATGDGDDVLAAAQRWSPDLVLLGERLADADAEGDRLGRKLRDSPSRPTVLVLVDTDAAVPSHELRHGGLGYLPLDTPAPRLITLVDAALDGRVIDPRPHPAVARADACEEQRDAYRAVQQLTSRERDVLTLLAEGASNQRIAEILHVTINTASTHVKNIFAKLQVHSRIEALMFAMRSGVMPPSGRMCPPA